MSDFTLKLTHREIMDALRPAIAKKFRAKQAALGLPRTHLFEDTGIEWKVEGGKVTAEVQLRRRADKEAS